MTPKCKFWLIFRSADDIILWGVKPSKKWINSLRESPDYLGYKQIEINMEELEK